MAKSQSGRRAAFLIVAAWAASPAGVQAAEVLRPGDVAILGPAAGEVEIEGVATADLRERVGGILVESEVAQWDADPGTPEGILVLHTGDRPLIRVGDRVRAAGRVVEHPRGTALGELRSIVRTGAVVVGEGAVLRMPFPEAADDWLRRWEGMRVRVEGPLYVADVARLARYGQIMAADREHVWVPTQRAAAGSVGFEAFASEVLAGMFRIDDGFETEDPRPLPFVPGGGGAIRAGDRWPAFSGAVLRDGEARVVVPIEEGLAASPQEGRPLRPPEVGGSLQILFWNLSMYFNGDGRGGGFPSEGAWSQAEFERQTSKVTAVLKGAGAEVMALAELENDGGEERPALAHLAIALDEACGSPGRFGTVAMEKDEAGFFSIANGLIFDSQVVRPVGRRAVLRRGVFATHSRPPLFQVFEERGSGMRFGIVVNHFRSRLPGGNPGPGDMDIGDGGGWWNGTRVRSARELADWIAEDPTGLGARDVLIVGDLNAYAMEEPLALLRARGFMDLIMRFQGEDAFTFIHEGQAGVLDHVLGSASLAGKATGAEPWSINAAEGTFLDYRIRYKDAGLLRESADHVFRSSDHDPVLVGFDLSGGAWDGDGDGFSDLEEGAAGTNPADGRDFLRCAIKRVDRESIEVGFEARAGRRYGVETSEDLVVWRDVWESTPGEEEGRRVVRVALPFADRRFVRLWVRLQDD